MKKIVMFIGGIETQGYFSLQMKKAFEKMGHEVCVFDYEKSWQTLGELIRFCGNGNTVMITFNFHGICGEEIFSALRHQHGAAPFHWHPPGHLERLP